MNRTALACDLYVNTLICSFRIEKRFSLHVRKMLISPLETSYLIPHKLAKNILNRLCNVLTLKYKPRVLLLENKKDLEKEKYGFTLIAFSWLPQNNYLPLRQLVIYNTVVCVHQQQFWSA